VTSWPFSPLDQHYHEATVEEFRLLVQDMVRRIRNAPYCPPRPPPRLIWVGTPSFPPRYVDPKPVVDPPVEGTCA